MKSKLLCKSEDFNIIWYFIGCVNFLQPHAAVPISYSRLTYGLGYQLSLYPSIESIQPVRQNQWLLAVQWFCYICLFRKWDLENDWFVVSFYFGWTMFSLFLSLNDFCIETPFFVFGRLISIALRIIWNGMLNTIFTR